MKEPAMTDFWGKLFQVVKGEIIAKNSQQQKIVMEERPVWLEQKSGGDVIRTEAGEIDWAQVLPWEFWAVVPNEHEEKRWTPRWFGKEIKDKEEQHNQWPPSGEMTAISQQSGQPDLTGLQGRKMLDSQSLGEKSQEP